MTSVAPVTPTIKLTVSSRDCDIQFEYKDKERKPDLICLRLFKELNRFYSNTPDYKIENLEPSTDYAILLYIKNSFEVDEVITFKTKGMQWCSMTSLDRKILSSIAEQRNQQQGMWCNYLTDYDKVYSCWRILFQMFYLKDKLPDVSITWQQSSLVHCMEWYTMSAW